MTTKIYSTTDVASKTGLSDRAVRRRLDTEFAPRVEIHHANRVTYGVTETSLKNYLKNNRRNGR